MENAESDGPEHHSVLWEYERNQSDSNLQIAEILSDGFSESHGRYDYKCQTVERQHISEYKFPMSVPETTEAEQSTYYHYRKESTKQLLCSRIKFELYAFAFGSVFGHDPYGDA